MEKIRYYGIAVVLTIVVTILCGCYRQTTVILAPGETISRETLSIETTASMQETTAATEASKPSSSGSKDNSNSSTSSKPSKPAQTQKPEETTTPVEPTIPAETTMPVATTVPAAVTTPSETGTPENTAAPATEPSVHPVYNISNHSIGSYERSILEELNRYRTDAELSLLIINKKLSALAAIRAYECSQEFRHTRPDGRSWDTVLSDYSASAATESIHYVSSGTNSTLLIDACMGSDSHSQKILNSSYSTVGIGVYDAGRYVFIVILFS